MTIFHLEPLSAEMTDDVLISLCISSVGFVSVTFVSIVSCQRDGDEGLVNRHAV